jgi:uncharacterized lipoprotein YbaY
LTKVFNCHSLPIPAILAVAFLALCPSSQPNTPTPAIDLFVENKSQTPAIIDLTNQAL